MSDGQFSRSAMLYGMEAQRKIESATVMVCGIGAVGSFATEALARVGVGNFILIDSDVVAKSNINRQLCALHSTIGKSKTEVMQARIMDINPSANVQIFDEFIDATNVSKFVDMQPTVIVDAIDSISVKAELACVAISKKVPIVSSMGAGRKTDPTLVEVSQIFKTYNCPLASRMRKELRLRGLKNADLPCVFSPEMTSTETHINSGNSEKIIGSTPMVTGVFGLMLANLALGRII